jgi:hypothetical protein
MNRRPVIFCVLSVLLAGVAVIVFAISSPARQPKPLLTFLSFTNLGVPDPPQPVKYETFAAFRVTNTSPQRVLFRPTSLELWTESGWQVDPIGPAPTNWPHCGGSFGPRESWVFYVPPPTNKRWRIRLAVWEHAEGWRGYRDRLYDFLANRRSAVQCETFSGRTYQLLSSEVTQ